MNQRNFCYFNKIILLLYGQLNVWLTPQNFSVAQQNSLNSKIWLIPPNILVTFKRNFVLTCAYSVFLLLFVSRYPLHEALII